MTEALPARGRSAPLRAWSRISPRLVPVMAVVTAFIIGIPFIIFTGAGGSLPQGLRLAGVAYSALIEGATGIVINDLARPGHLDLARQVLAQEDLNQRGLGRLARASARLADADIDELRAMAGLLERLGLDDEAVDALGTRLHAIRSIGQVPLDDLRPLLNDLAELPRAETRRLAEAWADSAPDMGALRSELEPLAPAAAAIGDGQLLKQMRLVDSEGLVALLRILAQLDVARDLGLDPAGAEADLVVRMAEVSTEDVRDLLATLQTLDQAGVDDIAAVGEQLTLLRRLYDEELLLNGDSARHALEEELPTALANTLVVRRPGNRLLLDRSPQGASGLIREDSALTPDDPTDDRPEVLWLRLGERVLMLIIPNLESMFVRSIPYVIAGLAVALGFKAGLFNIGAEGQLYAGAIIAVVLGFTAPLTQLPGFLHLPLVLAGGMLGGFLWGAIPGVLRAWTGAHEVITTIMLNFIAILTVDWLIKTPGLLRDPDASLPRTAYISASARLPVFSQIGAGWYLLAALLLTLWLIWRRRHAVTGKRQVLLRPLLAGALLLAGGLILSWLTVRDHLHLGLLVMVIAVLLTDWFLFRTTPGFELRTVGANPDAARYAGMNVRLNIVLAMALSGMLAGIAGTIQVAGVQFNLQPEFFAGLGFQGIAVALLARTNPRNMIPAGFLWGALLTGAPLMQVNANISIDLVIIIQALIIMFIAADAIIRYLWRVPKASIEEQEAAMFSKGWGG